jgi:hypothetical protein
LELEELSIKRRNPLKWGTHELHIPKQEKMSVTTYARKHYFEL